MMFSSLDNELKVIVNVNKIIVGLSQFMRVQQTDVDGSVHNISSMSTY